MATENAIKANGLHCFSISGAVRDCSSAAVIYLRVDVMAGMSSSSFFVTHPAGPSMSGRIRTPLHCCSPSIGLPVAFPQKPDGFDNRRENKI